MSFGTQIFSRGFRALIALALPLVVCTSLQAAILRVDINVPPGGAGNGSSWPDAFKYLPDALAVAQAGDQVWVAESTYYPDECDTCGPGGTDFQTDAFDVPLEVKVYGGFPTGGGDGTFGARNPALFETVLSGDIDQDDLNSPAQNPGDIMGANSFHVLTIGDADPLPPGFPGTVVDGFTITAGNANHPTEEGHRVGGGAFVASVLIFGTPLSDGPKFQNCTFVGNRSEDVGGALACADVGVEVRDCLILNNETFGGHYFPQNAIFIIGGGGGIAAIAPFVLVNSRIVGNKCVGVGAGGGVSAWPSDGEAKNVLASCLFAGNEALMDVDGAGGVGGGARIQGGEVMNCVFSGNMADFGDDVGTFIAGGGLRGTADVYLSSFYGNMAPKGNGGGVAFISSNSSITNSIAWGNTDSVGADWRQQIFSGPGICPTWNNIEDWDCAVGGCVECNFHNICADPYFVDPDGTDDMLGTADDNLHLRLDSPSIDKGSDASPLNVPLDSGDVDDDDDLLEQLPWDLATFVRKFDAGVAIDTGNLIDQGAYEEQCLACPWDLNGDGTVGSADLLILQVNWGALCHHANFLEPDRVGREDQAALLAHWGDCPHGCSTAGSSGSSHELDELDAATQLMGFDDSEAYGEWLREEATDEEAELSLIVLIALIQE